MIAVTNGNRNLNKDFWLTEGSITDAMFKIVIEEFKFYSAIKSKSSKVLSELIDDLFSIIKIIFAFPFIVLISAIAALLYLIVAPTTAIQFLIMTRRVKKLITKIESDIKSGVMTKEKLIQNHELTQKLLDKIVPLLPILKGEFIISPALNGLVNEIKKVEMKQRVAAYPEENEILLTYDELKELEEQYSSWEYSNNESSSPKDLESVFQN